MLDTQQSRLPQIIGARSRNSAASSPIETKLRKTASETVSVAKAQRTAVALILDHPLRDLSGLTLTAAEIAWRDGAALLIPMYRQATLFEWARPRALLVNYVRPANSQLRRWAHEREVPVAVLETEGAPYIGIELVSRGTASDPDAQKVTAYLFWSETMRAAMQEVWSHQDEPRFEVTGHPRYDLLVEPLRSQALPPKLKSKPVILFATSFPMLNNFANYTPASELIRRWEAIRKTDLNALDTLLITATRLIFVLKAVRDVAQVYPDAQVIVRPHPFEAHDLYVHAFADLDNVEVSGKGSSMEVIASASVFFHCRSNTGFEARALNVPSASLVPDRAPQLLPVDKTSAELSTLDEVLAFVEAALRGTASQPEIPDEDFQFALGAHRGSSALRVAEAVVSIANLRIKAPSLLRLPKRTWVRQWEAVMKRGWTADETEKRKFFDAATVQTWLDHWSNAYHKPRMRARNVVGRPFLDPAIPIGAAPLAVEVTQTA